MILYFLLVFVDLLCYVEVLIVLYDVFFGLLYLDIEDISFINNIIFGMKIIQVVV